MIGNAIVISDANILIDLLTINLIEEFCLLPVSKYTSQFVVQEIKEPIEQEILRSFLDKKQIIEQEFEFEELVSIKELNKRDGCSSLSFTDCSVWYLSKKLGGLLLTGDRQLRLIAESDKIRVSGILFIFDKLIEHGIITSFTASQKLKLLMSQNQRLPLNECNKRLTQWNTDNYREH